MCRAIFNRPKNIPLDWWPVAWSRGHIICACLLLGISIFFSGCKALSSTEDETDLGPATFEAQVEGNIIKS